MKEQIKYMKIADVRPYENNPRKNDQAVDMVAESIKEFGFKNPIIIDKNAVIIAGHTRLKAAQKIGLEEVPVIVADDLTEDQARAFRLVDNRTAEIAEWDFEKLTAELEDVDLDLTAFDFTVPETINSMSEYEQRKREFEERMEAGELSEDDEEYQEFLRKFEPKRTTDDCYTPPIVYEAVADYVAEHYGLNKADFVRPFVPQGDYQREKYKATDVVVDNPPFSILSEIVTFYQEHGVRFFLFAPALTVFGSATRNCACLCVGVAITYENGANVSTSFVTNLEDCAFRSAPKLYAAVRGANKENLRAITKTFPKYSYPLNVVLSPMLTAYSLYGIDFEVDRGSCAFIRQLDAQRENGKGMYGSGFLISDQKKAEREKAEREKAEREKAERWELSEREIEIVRKLTERGEK